MGSGIATKYTSMRQFVSRKAAKAPRNSKSEFGNPHLGAHRYISIYSNQAFQLTLNGGLGPF